MLFNKTRHTTKFYLSYVVWNSCVHYYTVYYVYQIRAVENQQSAQHRKKLNICTLYVDKNTDKSVYNRQILSVSK